jgi:hypothetical protein
VGAVGSTAAWPASSTFLVKLTLAKSNGSRHCKQYVTTLWPRLCSRRQFMGVRTRAGIAALCYRPIGCYRFQTLNAHLSGSERLFSSQQEAFGLEYRTAQIRKTRSNAV